MTRPSPPVIRVTGNANFCVRPTEPYQVHIIPARTAQHAGRIVNALTERVGGAQFSAVDHEGAVTSFRVDPLQEGARLPSRREVVQAIGTEMCGPFVVRGLEEPLR